MERDFAPQVFEAVTAYAIDEPRRSLDTNTLLHELKLDETKFCTELYVERPRNTEAELEKYILKGSRVILVYGFPGTGKTSLVAKALHHLSTSSGVPKIISFRVDFKELEHREGPKIEQDVRSSVEAELMHVAQSKMMEIPATQQDLVMAFLEPSARNHEVSHGFQDRKFKLFGEHRASTSLDDFPTWVHKSVAAGDARVTTLVSEMSGFLTIPDYLHYLTSPSSQCPNLCVLVFDNMDSMISNKAREHFYIYVRGLCAGLQNLARVVVVGRTTNLVKEQLSDFGTYSVDDIAVDYSEFLDDTEFEDACRKCKERKGVCSELDKMNIRARLESSAKQRFAHRIIEKRTRYLDAIAGEGFLRAVDSVRMKQIRECYALVMANEHIYASTFELANLDRREMLMHISNFVRFVTEKLRVNAAALGADDRERRFVLESYFYHWINDRRAITGVEVYDLVRDWQDWQATGEGLGCSLTHLIIATIHNLTGQIRGKHADFPRTTIGHVTDRLAELGYKRRIIMERIFEIYKRGEAYMGMLETGQFYQVKSVSDLKSTDAIWLTPRAAYICEYLTFKLLYMLSSLRKSKYAAYGDVFNFDDSNPVTVRSLAVNLKFLCHLAEMHIKALSHIKALLDGHTDEDWLSHYRRCFCILADTEPYGDLRGDLLFRNILKSHIKFLRHQGDIEPWLFINEMGIGSWYDRLLKAFNDDVDLLARNELEGSTVSARLYGQRIRLSELSELKEVTLDG